MKKYSEILNMSLMDLVADLNRRYCIQIPTEINSPEAMQNAGNLLGHLTNSYSYLMAVLALLKASTRDAKKKTGKGCSEQDKALYEDLVGKRDAVADAVEMVKQEYNAVSRMITVKIEVNRELKMSDGR